MNHMNTEHDTAFDNMQNARDRMLDFLYDNFSDRMKVHDKAFQLFKEAMTAATEYGRVLSEVSR